MKNNKGYTLVELLAVVTIMGILAMVAIPAVTKYVRQTREQSIETMVQSMYEAAENYMMKENIIIDVDATKEIDANTLVEKGFLGKMVNPYGGNDRSKTCSGNVLVTRKTITITKDGSNIGEDSFNYTYKVTLNCPGYKTVEQTFPKTK